MEEKIIYRLNEDISFRKCTLFQGRNVTHGDCTNFDENEKNWKKYYDCFQSGIHLHCTEHPAIEFDIERSYNAATLKCPKCSEEIKLDNFFKTINQCLRMLNIEKLKDAKLVRLDDWYVPEVKRKEKIASKYWITTEVKTDKDGDTIIIVYVGHVGEKEKVQFFIKPEKGQLTSDHKDLDPAKILSKIEITLKNRTLSQKYDEPQ